MLRLVAVTFLVGLASAQKGGGAKAAAKGNSGKNASYNTNAAICTGLDETSCRSAKDTCKWKAGKGRGRSGACYGRIICEDLAQADCITEFKCDWDTSGNVCFTRPCDSFSQSDCVIDRCTWDAPTNACRTLTCAEATKSDTCRKLSNWAGCRWSKTGNYCENDCHHYSTEQECADAPFTCNWSKKRAKSGNGCYSCKDHIDSVNCGKEPHCYWDTTYTPNDVCKTKDCSMYSGKGHGLGKKHCRDAEGCSWKKGQCWSCDDIHALQATCTGTGILKKTCEVKQRKVKKQCLKAADGDKNAVCQWSDVASKCFHARWQASAGRR